MIDNFYGNYRPITQSTEFGYRDSYSAALYQLALQRQPFVSETDYWADNIDIGSGCLADAQWILNAFLNAVELQSGTPITGTPAQRLANAERRVHRLYWAAFNRQPDPGGFAYWSDILANHSNPEGAWDWMTNHFVYTVTETTLRLQGFAGQERGPC